MLHSIFGFSLLSQLGIGLICVVGAIKAYLLWVKGVCTSRNKLTGKTVIITGANAGIGKETAIDLASRGARIIMACRDLKKAAAAKDEIIELSGNKNVVVRHLDLASFKSVRKFAADILKSEPRLDILINNAGCAGYGWQLTEDGLESQIQSNHFGHFLLTNLLLGLIIKTDQARIINVSAEAHKFFVSNLDTDDFAFVRNSNPKFPEIYCISKLYNILFTRELAKKLEPLGKNVTVNALHPGVFLSEFQRFITNPLLSFLWPVVSFMFLKTVKEGAQTSIHLAVADEVANITGQYFNECRFEKISKQAQDPGLAKKLWEASETLVQLKPEERHF